MPRVRFMKKNQKASVDDKTEIIDERKDEVEDEDEDEDDWFKVKKDSETLEQFEKNKEEMNEEKKEKKKGLTRSKAAKKIRKKNILINQRVEFDENGNVRKENRRNENLSFTFVSVGNRQFRWRRSIFKL